MHNKSGLRVLVAVAAIGALSMLCIALACPLVGKNSLAFPAPAAADRRLSTVSMDVADLPPLWGHRTGQALHRSEAVGRRVTYYGLGSQIVSWIYVTQDVFIYPNEAESHNGFETLVDEAIPADYASEWPRPPDLDFSDHADELAVGCRSGRVDDIPLRSCHMIARYGDMTMWVTANVFDDRWITMPQFGRLLERLDAKLGSARKAREPAASGSACGPHAVSG